MMDKALYEEVLKMSKEMPDQHEQIKDQITQIQLLVEMFKVLQLKKPEQKKEETKIIHHEQEVRVPIMTGDFKKLKIDPEGRRESKFSFINLEEEAKILHKIQEQQTPLVSLTQF